MDKATCALGLLNMCRKNLYRWCKGVHRKESSRPLKHAQFRKLVDTVKEENVFMKVPGRTGYTGMEYKIIKLKLI